MSGINSLLKYRYQKKSNSERSSASPISIASSSDSDISLRAVVTQSKRGSCVVIDSEDECSISESVSAASSNVGSPAVSKAATTSSIGNGRASATTTAGDSPWLSKDKPQLNNRTPVKSRPYNNVVKSPYASSSLFSSSQSSSSSTSSSYVSDDDIACRITRLQDMFPDMSRATIEQELRKHGGSEERALDAIIGQRCQQAASERKRKLSIYQSNSSASSLSSDPPPMKRARPLPSESDGSQEISSPKPVVNSPPVLNQSEIDKKIQRLVDKFPNRSRVVLVVLILRYGFNSFNPNYAFECRTYSELVRVLQQNKYDVDLTIKIMRCVGDNSAANKVSLTRNVGSIKAFQASRVLARVNGAVVSPSLIKTSNTMRKRIKQASDDDDDDDDDDDQRYTEQKRKTRDSEDISGIPWTESALNFLNTATTDELCTLDGCSKKKAELIIGLRPFTDWDDVTTKFEENSKALPRYLPSECKELIQLRNNVRSLMERCQNISIEMENFIAELMSKTVIEERDGERGYITKQPHLIPKQMKLKPYQMVGLNWLILMHSHGLNGILGDEMGLGKTIQTIAFFAYLLSEGDEGPHLIVAPSSTLDNWLRELKTWCPALKVLMYYGSQEERREIRADLLEGEMEEFNIIVTTYNMASGSVEDRVLFKKTRFHYAVFDEGHMLKNMTSMRYRGLMKILAKRRLLLTGTPLQNNLLELMSLLSFAMPDMFMGRTDSFKKIFTGKASGDSRGSYEMETLEHAKKILKPFFLRRLKSEVMQQLPQKIDNIRKVSMAFDQQELYDELKTQFVKDVKAEQDKALKDKDKDKDKALKAQSGAAMMMQLRKAANHHLLHRRVYDDNKLRQMAALMLEEPTHRDANEEFVFEDMQVMSDFELHRLCQRYQVLEDYKLDNDLITDSGKFRYLDEILPGLKAKGDRVLLFSQFTMMLDIVEDYMTSRDHKYIRLDGSTPVAERQDLIDQFNTDADIFIFLLSTKAGGMGINLTAANTVILHDIDFNPYNDKQAEDRCHRIGQTRDVTMYRLISKNTIEEAMLRCAQAKLKLERDVTSNVKDTDEPDQNDVASLLKEALEMEDRH